MAGPGDFWPVTDMSLEEVKLPCVVGSETVVSTGPKHDSFMVVEFGLSYLDISKWHLRQLEPRQ